MTMEDEVVGCRTTAREHVMPREKPATLTPQAHRSSVATLDLQLELAPPIHHRVMGVVGAIQGPNYTVGTSELTGMDTG